jgi:hypothetical protein
MQKVRPHFRHEEDVSKLEGKARTEYCAEAKVALGLNTLKNELNMEINKASGEILRRTSCDSEIAFQRGRINAIENIEKRLKALAAENNMKKRR